MWYVTKGTHPVSGQSWVALSLSSSSNPFNHIIDAKETGEKSDLELKVFHPLPLVPTFSTFVMAQCFSVEKQTFPGFCVWKHTLTSDMHGALTSVETHEL